MKRFLHIWMMLLLSLMTMESSEAQSNNCGNESFQQESDEVRMSGKTEEEDRVRVTYYNNQLIISNAQENDSIQVKNMLGETLFHATMKNTEARLLVDLKRGFYIVQVDDYLQRIVVK